MIKRKCQKVPLLLLDSQNQTIVGWKYRLLLLLIHLCKIGWSTLSMHYRGWLLGTRRSNHWIDAGACCDVSDRLISDRLAPSRPTI